MLTPLAITVLAALSCCRPALAQDEQPDEATPAPEEVPEVDFVADTLREFEEFGYYFDVPPEVETLRRLEVRKRGLRHIAVGPPANRFAGVLEWHRGFGLWNIDSVEDMQRLIERQVNSQRMAFYDPATHSVAIIEQRRTSQVRTELKRSWVAHSFAHAWRNQDGGLIDRLDAGDPTTEEANLRNAILEGEAGFLSAAAAQVRAGYAIEDLAQSNVDSLFDSMLGLDIWNLTEASGTNFVISRWIADGFHGARDVWSTMPTSTEQLLHPDKFGADLPRDVDLPAWPADFPAAERIADDCLGELEVYRLLRLAEVEQLDARIAAAGWDGDRLAAFETETGDRLVAWRCIWDRELDAAQFYAAVAEAGDGEWRLRGRVIDWVRSTDGPLATRWLDLADQHPAPDDADGNDAASTARLEAAWLGELDREPFVAEGRLVVPRAGFSAALPTNWEERKMRELRVWAPEDEEWGTVMATVVEVDLPGEATVDELLEESVEGLEFFGATADEKQIIEIDGTRALMLSSILDTGGRSMRSIALCSIRGVHLSSITIAADLDAWDEREEELRGILESVRMDAEQYQRPPAEDDEDDGYREDGPPPTDQTFDLFVRDWRTREYLEGARVWVASLSFGEVYDYDALELARVVKERGRRFVADDRGRIEASYSSEYNVTVVAEHEASLGVVDLFFGIGPPFDIFLAPVINPMVIVVDDAGEPVADVPVAIVFRRDGEWEVGELERTDRQGEIRFPHALNEVADDQGVPSEVYVRLGFPLSAPQLVKLDHREPPLEPIVLELPPTGRLLVEGPEDSNYPTIYYLRELPEGPEFRSPFSSRAAREFDSDRAELFTHVGLDVELELSSGFGSGSMLVDAPTEVGETVEVEYRPKDRDLSKLRGEIWSSPEMASLSARLLDDGGRPVADTQVSWRLARVWTGDERITALDPGRRIGRGTARTDENGELFFYLRDAPVPPEAWSRDDPSRGGGMRRIVLGVEFWTDEEAAEPYFWSAVVTREIAVGTLDLGDQRPSAPREFVAVRVLRPDGTALEDAVAMLVSVDGNGSEVELSSTLTFVDGAADLVLAEPDGDSQLVVVVSAAGMKEARVELTEPVASELEVRLQPADDDIVVTWEIRMPAGFFERNPSLADWPKVIANRIRSGPDPGLYDTYARQDDTLLYRVSGLSPGVYTFRVAAEEASPQHELAGERYYPSSTRFAKREFELAGEYALDPLDLSERFFEIEAKLIGPLGQPFRGEAGYCVKTGPFSTRAQYWQGSSGTVELRLIGESPTILFQAPNCRSTKLEVLEGGVHRVELLPLLDVEVTPAGALPELSDGWSFAVALEPESNLCDHFAKGEMGPKVISAEGASFALDRAGNWNATWYLIRNRDGAEQRGRIQPQLDALEIADQNETQHVPLPVPSTVQVEEALKRLNR